MWFTIVFSICFITVYAQDKYSFNMNKIDKELHYNTIKAPLTDAELIEYMKYARWSHIYWAEKQKTNPQQGMGTGLFHENWMRIYEETIKSLEKQNNITPTKWN